MGVEPATVNRWEKGKREPGLGELERLAKALHVSPGYFFGEAVAEAVPIDPIEAWEIVGKALQGGSQTTPIAHPDPAIARISALLKDDLKRELLMEEVENLERQGVSKKVQKKREAP